MQSQNHTIVAQGTVTSHPPVPEGELCPTHGADCKAYPPKDES